MFKYCKRCCTTMKVTNGKCFICRKPLMRIVLIGEMLPD